MALSTEEIESGLKAILADDATPAPHPLGVLTTNGRTDWAAARAELIKNPANAENIKSIDSALFVVCLDDYSPKSLEEGNRQLLHGDARNRWFDKSFSLIISKDGKAGINFEHSWGDGVAVLRFMNEIFGYAHTQKKKRVEMSSPK